MEFKVPENYDAKRVDSAGNKYVSVPAISWFTNIPHKLGKKN